MLFYKVPVLETVLMVAMLWPKHVGGTLKNEKYWGMKLFYQTLCTKAVLCSVFRKINAFLKFKNLTAKRNSHAEDKIWRQRVARDMEKEIYPLGDRTAKKNSIQNESFDFVTQFIQRTKGCLVVKLYSMYLTT
jgi:phosphorylcholine metabolism protein LicD